MGTIASHFCQDGARDLLSIDKKIGVEWGSSKSSEKLREWPKIFVYTPTHFYSSGHTPGSRKKLFIKRFLPVQNSCLKGTERAIF